MDAGYEGKKQVVLVEAKNQNTENTIIRQLFYPFKQWQLPTNQKVVTLFFEKNNDLYFLWQFNFEDADNYNSIKLVKNGCYKIN
ncbi:MAG: hypothetical protein QNJ70_09215 [Xenococcaceae cyanobacterium MO_207.B15]|nr:hypothetical protein [Xenococcaceae cyanobacterium MO_207.B15]